MNNNAKKGLLGVVIVVICGLLYYFLYWTKTPAYSLNILREAVVKHDVVLFEKHFDTETFINRAFDDLLADHESSTGLELTRHPLGAGLVSIVKPGIVNQLQAELRAAVSGTERDQGEKQSRHELVKGVEKQVPYISGIRDVSVLSRDDTWAHVAVEVRDGQLEEDLTLKLKLYRLPDDTWQVKECTNLAEFIQERERLTAEKLAELNRGVHKKLQQLVAFSEESSRVVSNKNPFLPTYTLVDSFTVKNVGTKQLTAFEGSYVLPHGEQQALNFTKDFSSADPLAPGEEKSVRVRWQLNPLLAEEKFVIDNGQELSGGYHEITAVTFADGTSLQLLKELPVHQ